MAKVFLSESILQDTADSMRNVLAESDNYLIRPSEFSDTLDNKISKTIYEPSRDPNDDDISDLSGMTLPYKDKLITRVFDLSNIDISPSTSHHHYLCLIPKLSKVISSKVACYGYWYKTDDSSAYPTSSIIRNQRIEIVSTVQWDSSQSLNKVSCNYCHVIDNSIASGIWVDLNYSTGASNNSAPHLDSYSHSDTESSLNIWVPRKRTYSNQNSSVSLRGSGGLVLIGNVLMYWSGGATVTNKIEFCVTKLESMEVCYTDPTSST